MVKLGLIAFANDGGLGAQTRRLAEMLKPDRVMVIDSSGFSKNKTQHYEWYEKFNYFVVSGFPNNDDVSHFLPNLTHVLVCENPYNFNLVWYGQKQGTKILCQTNYEFCDNLDKPYLPVPDKFLMPSYWKLEEMQEQFGSDKVMYLPPPIDPVELSQARQVNLHRRGKPRFLHIIGTPAMEDRNGTFDVLDAVKLSKEDFELVIKTQHPLSMNVFLDDPRVTYEQANVTRNEDLYKDFDAMLLPRRWGGLSLTTCEAMMAGLPVLMTDISPNKDWLPTEWLTPAQKKGQFWGRSVIECFSVFQQAYADKIDWFARLDREKWDVRKSFAFEIAQVAFSPEKLLPKYLELFDNG